jgi:hypothetical protein
MKTKWFQRLGWFHVPVSLPGGLLSLFALLFCLTVFRAVDRHSHSASDTLYGVFPFLVCTFLLLDWSASRTSDRTACPLWFQVPQQRTAVDRLAAKPLRGDGARPPTHTA